MSSKIIIIATVVLLIASFSILFVIETKNHNPDYKKNWSVVSFENPRDNSLDFAIENHLGEKTKYEYEILADGRKIAEEKVEIEAGEKLKIAPVLGFEKEKSAKITIEVSAGDLKYGIYKNLGK
jgi:hypothetical protein